MYILRHPQVSKKHSQTWDQTTSDVRPQTKKHHISLKNPSDFSLNGLRLKGLRKKQHQTMWSQKKWYQTKSQKKRHRVKCSLSSMQVLYLDIAMFCHCCTLMTYLENNSGGRKLLSETVLSDTNFPETVMHFCLWFDIWANLTWCLTVPWNPRMS